MDSTGQQNRLTTDELRLIFEKSSVVIKSICVGVVFMYLVSIFVNTDSFLESLAVTPGWVFPPGFRIWSLVTHQFIEVHIWFVLIDIAIVLFCGKLLEPLWGALEMLIFFGVVTVGSALLSSVIYVLLYLTTFNLDYLFHTHLHGLVGYSAGVIVALKQTMGEQELPPKILKLRVRDLPLITLLVSILLRIVGLVPGAHPCMISTGLFISWVYLRFYQKQPNSDFRGDMSDSFNFASFFPEPIRPPIALTANSVHSFLVKMKICKKQIRKYDVGAPSPITITLPGMDPSDAERRRQIALKALDERLSRVEEQSAWPTMDEPAGEASENINTTVQTEMSTESTDTGVVIPDSQPGTQTTVA